jgi:hypothetical protein
MKFYMARRINLDLHVLVLDEIRYEFMDKRESLGGYIKGLGHQGS